MAYLKSIVVLLLVLCMVSTGCTVQRKIVSARTTRGGGAKPPKPPTPPTPVPPPKPIPQQPPVPPPPTPVPGVVGQLLSLHNAERQRVGAPVLTLDSRLVSAAQGHAAWMAATGQLTHTHNGNSKDRMEAAGYPTSSWGENIGQGKVSASQMFSLWLSSSGHAGNIRNSKFKQCGIAVVNGNWWVVDFASPKKSGGPELFMGVDTEPPGIVVDD